VRIVVTGASGNVGTALVRRLCGADGVDAVTGVARRVPAGEHVDWCSVDVGAPDAVARLAAVFAGAGAVVHLAWQRRPGRANVTGAWHVAQAAVWAGVPALVVASSVAAYAPGPEDERVGEDWPATGVPGSPYSRDKADVEALLDEVELANPTLRVVRVRPGLIFPRPYPSLPLLRLGRLAVVTNLRVQAVHADDVAEAYVRAVLGDLRGPVNLAADPVLDGARIAKWLGGRAVRVPPGLLRLAGRGRVRLAREAPLVSTARAEKELGWRPRIDALDALAAVTGASRSSSRHRAAPA
jgi:nucleoside-diphosphate-sugar epimerase